MLKPLKWILFLTFFQNGSANAQHLADSLAKALQDAPDDTTRQVLTFRLGEHYWFTRNIPKAIPYLDSSIRLADHYKYYPYQVNAGNLIANAYLRLQQYDSVIYYLNFALRKAAEQRDSTFLPAIHETYHHLYYELGDYDAALKWALLAADGYKNSKDPKIRAQAIWAYLSVGQVFRIIEQPEKAVQYFMQAHEEGKMLKRNSFIKEALLNLAIVYKNMNRLTQARKLFDTVLILDRNYRNHESSMFAYEGIAQIYLLKNDERNAMKYLDSAISYAKTSTLHFFSDNLLREKANTFQMSGKVDSAILYFNQAADLSRAGKDTRNLMDIYTDLALLEKNRRNFGQALTYQEMAAVLRDSLLNAEKIRYVNNLEVLHRTQHQQAEINRLQNTQFSTTSELQKTNVLLWIAGTLLVAFVITFSLYHRTSRHKQLIIRQQQELKDEKIRLLEAENKLTSLQNMIKGQDMERTRIARELHDSVCSLLSIIIFRLKTARQQNGIVANGDSSNVPGTIDLTTEALNEIRRISHNLAPEILRQLGLKEAILEFCNKMKMQNILNCKVQIFGLDERLPVAIESNLFAIVQELLQNVIKHSQATEVIVQINYIDERLTLAVEDNGIGLNKKEINADQHMGISTIQNRVWLMNGEFSIESEAGVGTTALLTIPVARKYEQVENY